MKDKNVKKKKDIIESLWLSACLDDINGPQVKDSHPFNFQWGFLEPVCIILGRQGVTNKMWTHGWCSVCIVFCYILWRMFKLWKHCDVASLCHVTGNSALEECCWPFCYDLLLDHELLDLFWFFLLFWSSIGNFSIPWLCKRNM